MKLFLAALTLLIAQNLFASTPVDQYALQLEKLWLKDGVTFQKGIDKQGVQHISVIAHEGYWVLNPDLKAGIPTKLHIYTNKTYDCSRAVVIQSLGVKKILKASGVLDIDIPAQVAGKKLDGQCGMAMYFFSVIFNK